MNDNITLPREVVEDVLYALVSEQNHGGDDCYADSITALRAALAAEQPKPEPVAWQERRFFPKVDEWTHWYDCRPRMADYPREQIEQNGVRYQWRPLYAAPPDAPTVEESLRHPGYIIGSHWFEIAYERLCAGEAEDAILEDYELVREPRLRDLRRDAERYRWVRERAWFQFEFEGRYGDSGETIQELDAAIDAAMEASTAPASAAADASKAPEDKP